MIKLANCNPFLQNVNATGFRVCLKELYETRYDPVSVNYAVLSGQLIRKIPHLKTWPFYWANYHVLIRDGPLGNIWGGGGAGEVQKKIRAKENLIKKNSCTPINRKKYSCKGLKKIHTRSLITKKNSCGSKIPLPPITFLMVRPLVAVLHTSRAQMSRGIIA